MRAKTDYFFRLMRGPGVLVLPLFIIFLVLHLILHLFLHPFTVSSGRAQGGPALAAFWARVREATGSSSGAAAAAAFFIAALDAFAARGKACGETCVEGGYP